MVVTAEAIVNEAVKYWTLDREIWRRKGLRSMNKEEREGYLALLMIGLAPNVVHGFLCFIRDMGELGMGFLPEELHEVFS